NVNKAPSMHVPFGHVVPMPKVAKWLRSQLAQGMQGKIKLVCEDGLTPDFYLSGRSCILYVTETDFVAGNGYRKRLVQVRNSGNLQGIVVFTVLDLGVVLLPVANQMDASCLIVQVVQEQSKEPSKNPFLRKKRALLSEPYLLRTVQQIPGVGKVKASLLLQKFPSIQQLSNASVQELEPGVGQVVHSKSTPSSPRPGDSCPHLLFSFDHELQDLVVIFKRQEKKPGTVAHTSNPGGWKAEERGPSSKPVSAM
uniref:Fanconi anemia core complex-associated protein 24 pseudonuclease domain-containing protein n=1 Tax=Sciurus vulgaris TaxID=55149 RepID=A0A8D2DL20_SCIVU